MLDPPAVPANYSAMPASCAFTGAGAPVTTDGNHIVYAAMSTAPTAVNSKSFKIDKTPPTVVGGTPNRAPNGAGWFSTSVTIVFTGSDAVPGSGISGCTSVTYSGPDTAAASVSSTCTDKAGNVSAPGTSSAFKYDASGPTATLAVVAGTMGLNGWYTSNVTVRTSGADTVSAPVTCTADVLVTADTAGRTINGNCVNAAGVRTNAPPLLVKLDKTPPTVSVTVDPNTLWPANHQLVDVSASVGVTDGALPAPGFVLSSVTSSDPDDGAGDGDTTGDIQGFLPATPDTSGQLRAERAAGAKTRFYTLTYTATDPAGNSGSGSATVEVRQPGPGRPAISQGADRVVALQRTDAGWEGTWFWYVGNTVNATNLTGVTALGLLEAYADTKDSTYLEAAKTAAGFAMAHLGYGATLAKYGPRMTAPDVILLHRLTEVTRDGSYAARANVEWANIKTNWPTAAAMDTNFKAIQRRLGAWDMAAYLEAAQLSGDTAWADGAAAILANTADLFYYGEDNPYYPMTVSGALRVLAGYGYTNTYAAGTTALLNMVVATITGDHIDGWVQATAYAAMAMRAVGGPARGYANAMAKWLAGVQRENGGWLEGPDEYPESNGEALRALADKIGSNVATPSFTPSAGSNGAWRVVAARGKVQPFDAP